MVLFHVNEGISKEVLFLLEESKLLLENTYSASYKNSRNIFNVVV
jgi:hypothetical protein